MEITYRTRPFYPDELRLLKTLRTQKEKEGVTEIRFKYFLVAGLLGVLFTYVTTLLPNSFWTFLFGTLAIFSFAFIVFMPYEIYKMRRKEKVFLQSLHTTIEKRNSGHLPH